MIEITDENMTLYAAGRVVATARFSADAADGHGAWIVSCHPSRLFTHSQAITAVTAAELVASGRADGDPLVVTLQEELR